MYCPTWNHLFERYEKVTLERVTRRKNRFLIQSSTDLDDMNHKIAMALRELHEHETQHGCH